MTDIHLCGQTAFHRAAAARRPEALRLLLAANADPLARDDDGWLPIECAVQGGSAARVRLLLPSLLNLLGKHQQRDQAPISSSPFATSSSSITTLLLKKGSIRCGDVHRDKNHGD